MATLSLIDIRLLDLLRIAMGADPAMQNTCTAEEWRLIYNRAKEHAILGLLYKAVLTLSDKQMPPSNIIGRLYSDAQFIRTQNENVRAVSLSLQSKFREAGFCTAILKGTGNGLLYYNIRAKRDDGNDIGTYRTAGDIDIWLIANGCTSIDANRIAVIDYVRKFTPLVEARIHHIELSPVGGVPVEAHYVPMFFYSFRSQRRFQKLCIQQAQRQTHNKCDGLYVPTADFNAVYQLSHILRHLFEEGVGLKQIVDYYYVLLSLHDCETNDGQLLDVAREIDNLCMHRLAAAMMYVMQTAFHLPNAYLICKPEEHLGKILMREVLGGGYLGIYDNRKSEWRLKGKIAMFVWKWKFNMRLWLLCPREVLCGPLFRLWHYGWRRHNGYIPS